MATPTQIEGQKVRDHVDATAAVAAKNADDRHRSTVTEIGTALAGLEGGFRDVAAEVRKVLSKHTDLDAKFDRRLKELEKSRYTPVLTSLVVLAAFILGAWIGSR